MQVNTTRGQPLPEGLQSPELNHWTLPCSGPSRPRSCNGQGKSSPAALQEAGAWPRKEQHLLPRPSNALTNRSTLRASAPPPRRRRPAAPPGPVIIRQRAGTAASARVANQSRALPGGRVTGRAAKQKSLINSGRRAGGGGGGGGPERVGVWRPHLSSVGGGERRRRQRVRW